MSTEAIIALVFSGIGTITGTIAICWNINKERPKIKIDLLGVGVGRQLIAQITNIRTQPIKLDFYGIEYSRQHIKKHRHGMTFLFDEKDRILQGRDNCVLNVDLEVTSDMENQNDLKYFFVVDATNNKKREKIPNKIKQQIFEGLLNSS